MNAARETRTMSDKTERSEPELVLAWLNDALAMENALAVV